MRKYPNDVKIKAYTLYAVLGSVRGVARELDVPVTTVSSWIKNKPPDVYEKIQNKVVAKQEETAQKMVDSFIKKSDEILNLALDRLRDELSYSEIPIPVNQLATVIATIYDKRALAKGDATSNNNLRIILPDGAEEYAK